MSLYVEKYDAYKESGLNWASKFPKHWKVVKIFHGFYAKKGVNAAQLTKEYCTYIEGPFPVYSGQTENNGVMATINHYEFDVGEKGCLFSTTVGAKAMTVMKLNGKFSLSQNCMAIFPRNEQFNPRFYFYHFQPLFEYERGLIPEHMQASFRMEDLYGYRIALPPLNEQIAIANFLDLETKVIDELIKKQEKLIELLEEERRAIISQAVSKGVDKTLQQKESGILWLGKIPGHWELRPLKYLISFNDEVLPESTFDDFELRYVEVGDVSESQGISTSTEVLFKNSASRARRMVQHGDILISTVRTYLRAIAPVINPPSNMIVSTGFAVIRPKKLNSDYARYLLSSEYFLSEVISRSKGVSYPAINPSELVQIKVPVPPMNEQEEIAAFINNKCEGLALLVTKAQNSIELLKEHRASLVSAAVTGQIDVREAI